MDFLVIPWVIFSIAVAMAAASRGRDGFGWFLIALLISPLFSLILLLAMPTRSTESIRDSAGEQISPETHVRCPDCRELIRADASKCRYCGAKLVPQKIAEPKRLADFLRFGQKD